MPKYYFTFCQRMPTKDCFVVIEATDYEKAREEMVEVHKDQWAFQYTEEEWNEGGLSQKERFNLMEIKL